MLQPCSVLRTGTAAKPSLKPWRNPSQPGASSVSAWAEPLYPGRGSVGMVAAGFRTPAQPCSAAVADPQLCECGAADACAELVNDGGASWPSAGRTEEHRAVLELRAHRCAPQRIILTLPLGVGCSHGFPGKGISRPLARARVLCTPSPATTRITTPARSLLALHPRGRPDLPALCALGTPDVGALHRGHHQAAASARTSSSS